MWNGSCPLRSPLRPHRREYRAGELSIGQMSSSRPIPGYAGYRTPMEGLCLCGSGIHPGGDVMAVPGRNAAKPVLRDVRRGRVRGAGVSGWPERRRA
jgi:phytoene dehydrogenase-like protein